MFALLFSPLLHLLALKVAKSQPLTTHFVCFEAAKRDFTGAKTSGQDEGFPDFCVFLLKAYLKYKSISLFFRTAGLLSSASTKEAQYYQKISPNIPVMLFCYTGYMVEWRQLITWEKEKFFFMSPVALWHPCIDYTKEKTVDYKPSWSAPSIHLIGNEKTSLPVN